MALRFIFRIIPVLVFYTNLLPSGVGGMSLGLVVLIRHKYRADIGIHEHELEHSRQWLRGLFVVFALRYLLSSNFRLRSEVSAYRIQLRHPPALASEWEYRRIYAEAIAARYRINISPTDALRRLE